MGGEERIIHVTDPAWLQHLKSLCLALPRREQGHLALLLLINLGLDDAVTDSVASALSDLT